MRDHARALWSILTAGAPGETYNVGGDSERRNIDVVRAICDAVDARSPRRDGSSRRDLISFVADRPGHDARYAIDATKIKQALGWTPSFSFDGGLRDTVDWYLENGDWWQAVQRERYAGERLGLEGGAGGRS